MFFSPYVPLCTSSRPVATAVGTQIACGVILIRNALHLWRGFYTTSTEHGAIVLRRRGSLRWNRTFIIPLCPLVLYIRILDTLEQISLYCDGSVRAAGFSTLFLFWIFLCFFLFFVYCFYSLLSLFFLLCYSSINVSYLIFLLKYYLLWSHRPSYRLYGGKITSRNIPTHSPLSN